MGNKLYLPFRKEKKKNYSLNVKPISKQNSYTSTAERYVYWYDIEGGLGQSQATSASESGVTNTMFGGRLEDSLDEETGVATFVLWCVEAIEQTGDKLDTDAIYRASGNQTSVMHITKQKEEDMLDVLHQETNVNVLTGALKLFFRLLDPPLLKYEYFNTIDLDQTKTFSTSNTKDAKKVIENLSDAEYKTLDYMLKHLRRVLERQSHNKMTLVSLGVVFGPTLMPSPLDSQRMADNVKQQNRVIELLLTEYDALFHPSGSE